MRILLLAVLVISACGKDEDDDSASFDILALQNTSWEFSPSLLCYAGMSFYSSATYTQWVSCVDGEGGQVQYTKGAYDLTATDVILTPSDSICDEPDQSTWGYELNGDSLKLSRATSFFTYKKFEEDRFPSFVRGCFDEQGQFTPK